jgi:ABC-2 type transport system ATP-binding protein
VLTTHYLEEAEALADRVIVVNKGRVIASGTVSELKAFVSRKHVSFVSMIPAEEIATWSTVASATRHDGRTSVVTTDAESVVRRLMLTDPLLSELEVRRAGLTDVFTELTQEGT